MEELKLLLPSELNSVAKSFIINDVLETNPKTIATAFNDVFVSISESLAEPFVGGEAFVFEHRVPNILTIKFQKLNHHMF